MANENPVAMISIVALLLAVAVVLVLLNILTMQETQHDARFPTQLEPIDEDEEEFDEYEIGEWRDDDDDVDLC
uniref:Col_cuticle_N domain-containing protein n=1 Tax=Steinernema glaseri TaxID=37863 RepID=A0A1I8AJ33_9BILA